MLNERPLHLLCYSEVTKSTVSLDPSLYVIYNVNYFGQFYTSTVAVYLGKSYQVEWDDEQQEYVWKLLEIKGW